MQRKRLSRAICSLIRHRDRQTDLPPPASSAAIGPSDGIAYQMTYDVEVDNNPSPLDVFMESGIVQMNPGPVAADLYYRAGMIGKTPPYLDTLHLPAPYTWTVRPYTAGMDSATYPAGHGDHADALNNKWAHSGRVIKLARAQLGSGESQSLKSLLEAVPTWALTYGLYTDSAGDYWLLRISRPAAESATTISRAQILFTDDGNILHSDLKTRSGGSIDRWSLLQEDIEQRDLEGYVYACATGIGAWADLATVQVDGVTSYGGWKFDWTGSKAVIVTAQQDPSTPYTYVLNGIRFRLYTLAISDSSAALTEEENVLGTPSVANFKIFAPDNTATPRRMEYWYFLDCAQSYSAEISSIFPTAAEFKDIEGEDDTYYVIRYRHDAPSVEPAVNYLLHVDAAGEYCYPSHGMSADLPPFTENSGGIATKTAGFFVDDSPGDAIDHIETTISGSDVYFLRWETIFGADHEATLEDTAIGGLAYHSCTTFDWTSAGYRCFSWTDRYRVLTLTCGEQRFNSRKYQHRSEILKSVLCHNYGGQGYTLIKRRYDGWSGMTGQINRYYNGIVKYDGNGHTKQWWADNVNSVHFPDMFSHWSTQCAGVRPPCWYGDSKQTLPLPDDVDGYTIDIEHQLILPDRTVVIRLATYTEGDELGAYNNFDPIICGAGVYPWIDVEIGCLRGLEGDYFATPALNAPDNTPITNTLLAPSVGLNAVMLGLF